MTFLDSCTSTNRVVFEEPFAQQPAPFAIATFDQRDGQGRQGRTWVNRPGRSLALTVVWEPTPPGAHMSWYPHVAALAVIDACADLLPDAAARPHVKWPNDILHPDGQKIAGLLAQMRDGRVAMGIGVNLWGGVDRSEEGLARAATLENLDSRYGQILASAAGRERFAEVLAARVVQGFAEIDEGDSVRDEVKHRYTVNCLTLGRDVVIQLPGQLDPVHATAHSIDGDGRLIVVRHGSSEHMTIDAADVHLQNSHHYPRKELDDRPSAQR